VITPDEAFTAQPDVVESSTEYEMLPLPAVVANADGVNGDCGIVTPVTGDHDTEVVPRFTVNDSVSSAAAR